MTAEIKELAVPEGSVEAPRAVGQRAGGRWDLP